MARSSNLPFLLVVCVSLASGACGGSTSSTPGTSGDGDTAVLEGDADPSATGSGAPDTRTSTGGDTSVVVTDSSALPSDTGSGGGDGGVVRRLPCVSRAGLASGLPADQTGALEGELVALVPPGSGGGCPSDADHLHLQLDVGGKRYDVAVDVNSTKGGNPVALLTRDVAPRAPLPLGWSAVPFDYVKDLGLHSPDFTPSTSPSALIASLTAELAKVSRVTIHGRSYIDGTGAHDIHRSGCCAKDGVILAHGVGAGGKDRAIALRFSTDTF